MKKWQAGSKTRRCRKFLCKVSFLLHSSYSSKILHSVDCIIVTVFADCLAIMFWWLHSTQSSHYCNQCGLQYEELSVRIYTSSSGTVTPWWLCFLFLPGPYSLNGYRVRVYRQDSATQWFTGIITHHDLFSRNMVVMNDQVHTHNAL